MGRNKDLIKNTTFVTIGGLGGSLVGFLMLPLYTRWLSPSDYGITDIISTYSSLLVFVVSFSISEAIFVFPVGQSKENIKKYYSSGWIFLLFAAVLCGIVFYLLSFIDNDSSFFSNIWLIYFTLFAAIILRYCQDFCRGIKKMSVFSFTGIIQSSSLAILSFLLIPTWGVIGFVIASVCACLCSALFSFIYSKSYQYLSWSSFDFGFLKEMLKFSTPLIPASIMWWVLSSLNRPLLEKYVGLFAIGLFAIANKLPSILNSFYGFFQKAWQVTVIEEINNKDFSDYYNRMFKMVVSIQVILTIGITAFSRLFVILFTTEEYYSAWIYIPLLSLSVLFSNTAGFAGAVFTASKETKYILYSGIVSAIFAIAANCVLIPWIGLPGACIALCLSNISLLVARLYYSKKYVTFRSTGYLALQMLAIAIVYGGVMTGNIFWLICSAVISLSVYIISNKNELVYIKTMVLQRFIHKR